MAGKRIFISYSRNDTKYVSSLAAALRNDGFDVWFDKNIRAGSDWDDTLEEELKKADAIVLVLSKTSVVSENVKDEMNYVLNLGKIINPIKIEECDVPMRLARKQFVDFTITGPEAGYIRLVKDIRNNLNDPNLKPPKPPTPPRPSIQATAVKPHHSIKPYIIGGFISIFLLVVVAVALDDSQDEIYYDDNVIPTMSDTNWVNALNTHTIDGYIDYIKGAGPNAEYFVEAQNNIYSLLPSESVVPFQDTNGFRYYTKLMYRSQNGIIGVGMDDNYPPNVYDILAAKTTMQVYDEINQQFIPGVNIMADDKIEVMRVDYYPDNSIWMKVAYAIR